MKDGNDVYEHDTCFNGKKSNYMGEEEIITAVLALKTKNCEGYDRIPQRVISDGIGILIKPLTIFSNKIYEQTRAMVVCQDSACP